MVGYTVKSTTDEGTFFLVKNWRKNKTFWKEEDKLKDTDLFTSHYYALRSLHRLLRIMPDYAKDDFVLEKVEAPDFGPGKFVFSDCDRIQVREIGNEWEPDFDVTVE